MKVFPSLFIFFVKEKGAPQSERLSREACCQGKWDNSGEEKSPDCPKLSRRASICPDDSYSSSTVYVHVYAICSTRVLEYYHGIAIDVRVPWDNGMDIHVNRYCNMASWRAQQQQ